MADLPFQTKLVFGYECMEILSPAEENLKKMINTAAEGKTNQIDAAARAQEEVPKVTKKKKKVSKKK